MSVRGWWFVGVVFVIAAVAMFMSDVGPRLFMPVAAIGLVICAVAQVLEVREIGMTADAVDHFAQTVMLCAIVVGFFFHQITWVLLACFACGIVALFVSFGAQIWGKWGESKDLWNRYAQ